MTLRELWMLVVRYWALVVVLVIACMLLSYGYGLLKNAGESFEAEAKVVAGSNLNSVAGFAENAARGMQPELDESNIDISVGTASNIMTITVTAKGPDPQTCVEMANIIAEAANGSATEMYAQFENPYKGEVSPAAEAKAIPSKSTSKFIFFGLVAGVFAALVGLLLLDLKKRSIKTAASAQVLTELPVLDILPAPNGEKLLANTRFAAMRLDKGNDDLSVLVVPVGQSEGAQEVVSLLTEAAAENSFPLQAKHTVSLSESMAGAYAAKEADTVVVVVEQWKDSVPALISCVDELHFAEAEIAGLVFCREAKRRVA